MSVSHNEEKKQKLARMKELIRTLNEAARVYYVDGNEIMSNLTYDQLYDASEGAPSEPDAEP